MNKIKIFHKNGHSKKVVVGKKGQRREGRKGKNICRSSDTGKGLSPKADGYKVFQNLFMLTFWVRKDDIHLSVILVKLVLTLRHSVECTLERLIYPHYYMNLKKLGEHLAL